MTGPSEEKQLLVDLTFGEVIGLMCTSTGAAGDVTSPISLISETQSFYSQISFRTNKV